MDILHLEKDIKTDIPKALETLKKGGLVIAPSDTIYGLLADASNEAAVKKLIAFKNRPLGKSISIFVSDLNMAQKYVEMDDRQIKMLKKLLPGPFTIVLPSRHKVSFLLESEKGTLGIRLPDNDFINYLIAAFGAPTTATSANLAGRSPHYSVESLLNDLPQSKKEMIDLIIDGGKLPRNKPSTVIDLTTSQLKFIRQGDISLNNLDSFVTNSPSQTMKTAQFIFKKIKKIDKPLIFILKGELGSGKTVFVKGIGGFLGIKNIISPTFTISYEYHIENNVIFNTLYHYDLYNIEDPEELKHIGLDEALSPGNIVCVEWGDKAGDVLDRLKQKGYLIYIEIKYLGSKDRQIQLALDERLS